jgi:hypothetical protein
MTWTIDLYNLTGSSLQNGNVAFVRATVRWRLDDPGSCEVDLRDDQIDPWLVPMRRRVVVRRSGTAVWAGILLGVEQTNDRGVPSYTARALGLRYWIERRLVHPDVVYTNLPSTTIAWNLISAAQAQANGGMGFTLGTITGTAPSRTRTYCEGDNILEAIRELAEHDTQGFDWEIDVDGKFNAWVGGRGANISTTIRRGDCLRRGGWQVDWNLAEADTYVSAASPKTCPSLPVVRSSMILPPAQYGRWESLVDSDVTSTAELQDVADEQLRASGRAAIRVRATRPEAFGSPWPGFELGDRPLVEDTDTALGALLPTRMRVIGYGVTLELPDREFLEVELEGV